MSEISVEACDRHGTWRYIELSPEISPEDFLQAICYGYEESARFVLDWAKQDKTSVVQFLVGFMSKVHRELNRWSHYLSPKSGVTSSFGPRRPSFSAIALHRFCELLHEDSDVVRGVRSATEYEASLDGPDLFIRGTSHVSLTRGTEWNPCTFEFQDPDPLPLSTKLHYLEQQREALLRSEEQRRITAAKELQELEERRRLKKQARDEVSRAEVERRRANSATRKGLRDELAVKPLAERLRILATSRDLPLGAVPLDPTTITTELLSELDSATLLQLMTLVSDRRKGAWVHLSRRIRDIQKARSD